MKEGLKNLPLPGRIEGRRADGNRKYPFLCKWIAKQGGGDLLTKYLIIESMTLCHI